MREKLPRVVHKDVVRELDRAGFVVRRQKGSHVHLRRDEDQRRVTVPVHSGRTLPPGTLKGILRDAGIEVEEFRQLI